jgi:outer membrane receptor for ferrienterochelin and colicins
MSRPESSWRQRLPPVWQARLKRVARLGFWFFLLKGLLWLLVPALLALWASEASAQTTLATLPVQPLDADKLSAPPSPAERAIELEAVVVTGTRTEHRLNDSPVEVQLITAQQIEDSGARDVAALLEREGGLTVTRVAGRGTSIEIQGLSSDQVLILVDGQRVVGRINGAIDLTRLKAANIERIEIVKGPSSALYGSDALGGVVNVITRDGGKGGSVVARADSGRNFEAFAQLGYEGARSSGSLSGGGTLSQGYDLDTSTPSTDGITGNTRFFNVHHRQQLSPAMNLGATLDYSLDDSSRTDAGAAVFDIQKRIEEVRAGVQPRLALGEHSELSLNGYFTRYEDQYLQDQRGSSANDRLEKTTDTLYAGGGQFDHRWQQHMLSLGLEAQYESLTADRLSSPGERDRQSVYVQDEWRLLADDALTLVPGLRHDRDSQFGSATSPKLSLRYNFTPDFFLRAGAGQGYRAPDFKQLLLRFDNPAVGYRVEGNPDLKPERSTGFNAGLTWLASSAVNVSGSVFHNRVKNLIDIVQQGSGRPNPDDPVVFSYTNIHRARLTGADLQLQWQPLLAASRPLQLRAGGGWLHSEDADTGEALSGRARFRANLDLQYRQALYELGLRGVWVGKRTFQVELDTGGAPTGAGSADPYCLLDARVQWKGWRVFDVTLGLSNLLDEGDPAYLPIPPRSVFAELRHTF